MVVSGLESGWTVSKETSSGFSVVLETGLSSRNGPVPRISESPLALFSSKGEVIGLFVGDRGTSRYALEVVSPLSLERASPTPVAIEAIARKAKRAPSAKGCLRAYPNDLPENDSGTFSDPIFLLRRTERWIRVALGDP